MSELEIVLRTRAVLPSVRLIAAAARAVLAEWHLPEPKLAHVELAVVEAATNIVRHAYRGLEPGPLDLAIRREGSLVSLEFADQGHPFDPQEVPAPPEPDPDDPDTWPEGGMGLPIIRSACDRLLHERGEDGTNRLVLQLSVAPPATR